MTLMLLGISLINVQAQNSPKWKHRGAYYSEMAGGATSGKEIFTFYDDYIESIGETHLKEGLLNKTETFTFSGTQSGYRVYSRTYDFGTLGKAVVKYFVDSNYNVRYFHNGQEYRMWKAEESPGSNRVGSYTGGNYGGYSGGGTTTGGSGNVPQQPERTHRHCNVCAGSGKCNICNGTGWVTRMGMGHDGYCASCPNHSGRCSACNGRGDWYE